MKQSSRLIDYLIFTLLFLLVFFLVFERFLVLPSFVQVLGRSHPLFLHLPIGFLILLGLLPLLKRQIQDGSLQVFRSFLLDIATLSLVLTALAGLFLAQEEGYQSASVNWHKWTAAAVSFITYGLLLWNRYFPDRKQVYYPMLYTNLVLLLVAGHIGGGLTHGKDFLLAPVKAEQAKAITENMAVYAAMVQPILDAKCVKCHSDAKSKGDLILIDQENILAGGKHGPVIIAGNVDSSSLIQRLNLPMEDEYHMPPEDQTQVNQSELQLLTEWVKAGADFTQTIEAVGQSTPLFAALKPIWEKTNQAKAQAQYDFPPLKNSTLSKLNTPFRTVRPTANGSPALSAKFFIAQSYQPIFLKELLVAKDQVTNINLSSMPIQADAFEILGQFPLLEKLLLNSTPINGEGLEALLKCKNLRELSLSNTQINKDQLLALEGLENLEILYLWSTSITKNDLSDLKVSFPDVQFELGYEADPTEVLQLSQPRFLNKKTILASDEPIRLESKIPGTVIRYTMDGDEPDSLEAPIYEQAITIDTWTTIKAKAYNPGWISSETTTMTVFPAGLQPDTVILQTQPNAQYRGIGAPALADKNQGKISNFRNDAWLGFRKEHFEVLIDFGQDPPTIGEVVGSFGEKMGSEIFLPERVEVWGGDNPNKLQILSQTKLEMPDGFKPQKTQGIGVKFEPSKHRYYLLKALPYKRLPSWHGGSNSKRKTWIFIDEVFFY